MGIECFRVQFPKGMDANEYALKVQPAAKSLGDDAESRGMAGQRRAAHGGRDRAGRRSSRRRTDRRASKTRTTRAEITSEEEPAAPIPAEETNPTAKEENALALPLLPPSTEEPEKVFSLAVEPEAGSEEEAAPNPPTPAAPEEWPVLDAPVEIHGEEIVIHQGDRRYRVRGLGKEHEL